MNPIINQLNRAVEAKTQAAVDKLHGLRVEVQAALEAAEAEARERIAAEVQALNTDVDVMLQDFGEHLAEMTRDFVGSAVGQLLEKVERLGCGCCTSKDGGKDETPEATFFSVIEKDGKFEHAPEVTEDLAAVEWAEIPGAVAAQVVERQAVGVVPTAGDYPSPQRNEVPGANPADELFERRGRGRKTTYVPVDLPEDGRTYFRRSGNDWEAVVFGEG